MSWMLGNINIYRGGKFKFYKCYWYLIEQGWDVDVFSSPLTINESLALLSLRSDYNTMLHEIKFIKPYNALKQQDCRLCLLKRWNNNFSHQERKELKLILKEQPKRIPKEKLTF